MFLHLSVILFTVATEAGGTHPTGMHTCLTNSSSCRSSRELNKILKTLARLLAVFHLLMVVQPTLQVLLLTCFIQCWVINILLILFKMFIVRY